MCCCINYHYSTWMICHKLQWSSLGEGELRTVITKKDTEDLKLARRWKCQFAHLPQTLGSLNLHSSLDQNSRCLQALITYFPWINFCVNPLLVLLCRFVLYVDPVLLVLLMFLPWLMRLSLWTRLEQFFLVVLHLLRYGFKRKGGGLFQLISTWLQGFSPGTLVFSHIQPLWF